MIKVKIEGLNATMAHLAGMQKQVRYATAVALTRTAKKAQAEVVEEMKRKFDRPTRTTLKSMFIKPATKANLQAMVYVKDRPLGGKNNLSMAQILGHQFTGGTRIHTNFERLLRGNSYMKPDEYIVPAMGARLNSHGNVSPGQYVQILSQIGVRRAGSDSASTKSARSRRNVQKAGEMFWSHGVGSFPAKAFTGSIHKIDWETGRYQGKGQHLPKGVWMRGGTKVVPVMLVIKGPRYRQRIDLDKIARAAVDLHFNAEFDLALAQAVATAK